MVAASVRQHRLLGLRCPDDHIEIALWALVEGKYRTGQICESSGPSLISSTMPTISDGLPDERLSPICLPMGSSPGKYCLANAWLMMATWGFDASSASVK